MANSVGSNIEAVDYNTIRNKINMIMGTGVGQFGYGQSLVSADVAQGNNITADHWKSLRWDIFNARVHQDGLSPSIVIPLSGETIKFGAGFPNNQYNSQSDLATVNKFSLGAGQFVIESGTTTTRATSWNTSVTSSVTVTFGTADRARWFFNSGGQIRFNSSRTGGSSYLQNQTWSATLERIGTVSFSAISPVANFYNLTNTNRIFYSATVGIYSAGSPYNTNSYIIRALCNVADNSQGGATAIIFTVTWQDSYVDFRPSPPPDIVDGNLTLTVSEVRASGVLQNGTGYPGSFSIVRPSYAITAITGS